jgi:hypothetical protein
MENGTQPVLYYLYQGAKRQVEVIAYFDWMNSTCR